MSRVLPYNAKPWEVRAMLDERKTVTRRVIKKSQCDGLYKVEPNDWDKESLNEPWCSMKDSDFIKGTYNPPYQPGDILYVRETWSPVFVRPRRYLYKVGCDETRNLPIRWRPSIHMPKEAARIWLKVIDIRVERLQEITEEQAVKEGIYPSNCTDCISKLDCDRCPDEGYDVVDCFVELWNSTIKKSDLDRYGWNANPYVFVIEFIKIDKPEEI